MEVILIKDVPNLGHVGDQVSVKPGYGRNFLMPKGFALAASVTNRRRLEHDKAIAARLGAKARAEAEKSAEQINGKTVQIARKVGEQGKLFGSVTAGDIADALAAEGVTVDKRGIQLANPLKELGSFDVSVRLRKDVEVQVKVEVVGES